MKLRVGCSYDFGEGGGVDKSPMLDMSTPGEGFGCWARVYQTARLCNKVRIQAFLLNLDTCAIYF